MNRSRSHFSFCVAQQTPHLVVRSHPSADLAFERNERLMRGILSTSFSSDWLEKVYLKLALLHPDVVPQSEDEKSYP